jgi:predicted metal-binding membrane protein
VALPIFLLAMAAMMLPSELPYLRLQYATSRSPSRTAFVATGYVVVWTALAAPLFFVPWRPPWELALAVAAAYQLTPVKRRCLAVCRAPLARVVHGWRDGHVGALRMGAESGVWCAGCCVGAMVVLLAAGMMSMWWMAAVGAAIFVEKGAFRWVT